MLLETLQFLGIGKPITNISQEPFHKQPTAAFHSRGPRRRRGGGGAGGGGCGARVRKRHILWRAQYRDAKEPCCQNTTICNCFHVSCDDLVVEC